MLVEEFFECLASLGVHFLDCNALMPDNDSFLGISFHIYYGADVDLLSCFLECLASHLYGIRNFLVVVEKNLLADDF